jgi:hypothetical protein
VWDTFTHALMLDMRPSVVTARSLATREGSSGTFLQGESRKVFARPSRVISARPRPRPPSTRQHGSRGCVPDC